MNYAGKTPCAYCGENITPEMRAWGLVWDGKNWRQYEWLPMMTWGPYHSGPCVSEGRKEMIKRYTMRMEENDGYNQ